MEAYEALPWATAPEDVGMSAERLERIRRVARPLVDDGSHPCHSILVSRGGKVAFSDVYGYADVEAKQPLKADAIFRWASMTKPVTCVAAMICYERGLFHLDDELSKYLPEWETTAVLAGGDADAPQLEAPATPITIKMLLTHTSGITSLGLVQSEAARMMSRLMKQRVEEHGQAPSDLKEHCEFLASAPLVAQPGTLWHYGAGLTVLGRLCEVWSGQSFDVFLQQNLFEPLGMVDAGFRIPMTKLHRLVQAYRYAGPQKMELVPSPTDGGQWTARGGVYDGSGGLAGTVADYFHFAQMLANKGVGSNGTRILGNRTVEFMSKNHLDPDAVEYDLRLRTSLAEHRAGPQVPGGGAVEGVGFGFGMAVLSDDHHIATQVMANAGDYWWGGAYSTYMYVDPTEHIVMLFMTQLLPTHSYPVRYHMRVAINQSIVEDLPGTQTLKDLAARL